MDTNGLDAFVVQHLPNVHYLSGFTGSSGVLVIGQSRCVLITDGRYTTQAREEARGARVCIHRGNPLAAVGGVLKIRPARNPSDASRFRVGFEAEFLSVSGFKLLRASGTPRMNWKPHPGAVEALRAVKDSTEVVKLRDAAELAGKVMAKVLPLVQPGVSELDLAAEIDYRMRKLGASGPSFETIVASGPRSALPHARPTSKRLRKNELVVLDLGAILRHYSSDLTRTVYLGRVTGRVQRMFVAVREAQAVAIAGMRPGVACGEVDRVARAVLRGHGLERFFTHSLGHGIGLEIHEGPRLAAGVTERLAAGNVVTVEPGVYLPGFGGIRIEDDVLITPAGAELLTRPNSEILEL